MPKKSRKQDQYHLRTFITVRDQFTGMHCWPKAPRRVQYLRELHRHLFKVKVTFEVNHGNRDLEFHTVQSWLLVQLVALNCELRANPSMSCEHMAEWLFNQFVSVYEVVPSSVTVSEDGENDGFVVNVGKEI